MFEFSKLKLFNKKALKESSKYEQPTNDISHNSAFDYEKLQKLTAQSANTELVTINENQTASNPSLKPSEINRKKYSFEMKKIDSINNCKNEDQLLNELVEYFLSKEDIHLFSCNNGDTKTYDIRNNDELGLDLLGLNGQKASNFKNSNCLNKLKRSLSFSRSKKCLNRCYYTSIHVHIGQFFKSMDLDFDHKLSFNEFSFGIKKLLNNNYTDKNDNLFNSTIAVKIVYDQIMLKRLFVKFDLNQDGSIDFGKILNLIYGYNFMVVQNYVFCFVHEH